MKLSKELEQVFYSNLHWFGIKGNVFHFASRYIDTIVRIYCRCCSLALSKCLQTQNIRTKEYEFMLIFSVILIIFNILNFYFVV